MRDFQAAAVLLEQHLKSNPKDTASGLLLGLCYQQSGDLNRAEQTFLRFPDRADALYYLARVRYESGRFAEALRSLESSEKLGYPNARTKVLLGLIRFEERHYDEALRAFQQARLTAEAGDPEPSLQAGKLLFKLGRVDEARAQFERIRTHPEAIKYLSRISELDTRAKDQPPASNVQFENVTGKSGIDFVLEHHPSPTKYLPETMAGGLAVFDYDSDGLLDLYFCNGAELPSLQKRSRSDWNRLYRNLGNFRFQDVTETAGVAGAGYSIGAAVGDFDNDTHPDLFVAGVKRHHLFRNRGDGSFEDVTLKSGIKSPQWAVGAGWIDYDRDGLLDLFIVNYVDWDPAVEPYCGDRAKSFRVYCHPRHYQPLANQLYRNLGNGRFEDVSLKSGIAAHKGKGMSVAFADYDGNGLPDIFVPNDNLPNFLFRNKGNGAFEEVANDAGVALMDDGRSISGMGSEFRDVDGDGRPDILFTALNGETFPFFRNNGNGTFRDATYPSGLGLLSSKFAGWGIAVADLNNDGWPDLFTANSHVTDNIDAFATDHYRQPNHVFLNSAGRFRDGGPVGVPAAHRGLAVADLDNDGRLDAVVTVLGGRPEIWRNISPNVGKWLKVEVTKPGTKVRVGNRLVEAWTPTGYASSVAAPLHFGLGTAKSARIEVFSPDGRSTVLGDIPEHSTVRPRL